MHKQTLLLDIWTYDHTKLITIMTKWTIHHSLPQEWREHKGLVVEQKKIEATKVT